MQITISTTTVPNYQGSGDTATLRIYANQTFQTSDGDPIQKSNLGGPVWYAEIDCTVAGDVLTIPAFTIDSTTDSSNPNGTYSAVVFDENGTYQDELFKHWIVPDTLGAAISYAQLMAVNLLPIVANRPGRTYTQEQTDTLVSATIAGFGKATELTYGMVRLSTAASPTTDPEALSTTDPRVGGVIGSYTKALLPATAHTGQRALVTDTARGIWRYVSASTRWVPEQQVYNVADFGATGDGVTNDTTAIQNAINAAVAAEGGEIFFPDGVYLHTGLTLPGLGITPTRLIAITFSGTFQPSTFFGTLAGGAEVLLSKGAVLKCLSTTVPAIRVLTGSASFGFSLYLLAIKGLTLRGYVNPQQPAVDASLSSQFLMRDCVVDTGTFNVLATEPTHDISAIRTPGANNGGLTELDNVVISGYYNGLEAGEHTNADNLYIASCKNAIYMVGWAHAQRYGRVEVMDCTRFIRIDTVNDVYFQIEQLDIEHRTLALSDASTMWQITDYDLYDPSNKGHGTIGYHAVTGGIGPQGIFTKSGGANVKVRASARGPESTPAVLSTGVDRSIPNTTQTALIWGTFSAGDDVDWTIANPTRVYALSTGIYRITPNVLFTDNATGNRQCIIYKNGNTSVALGFDAVPAISGVSTIVGRPVVIGLSAGDYIEVYVAQNSGGALNVQHVPSFASLLSVEFVSRQ